jgi:hypothetical protein
VNNSLVSGQRQAQHFVPHKRLAVYLTSSVERTISCLHFIQKNKNKVRFNYKLGELCDDAQKYLFENRKTEQSNINNNNNTQPPFSSRKSLKKRNKKKQDELL